MFKRIILLSLVFSLMTACQFIENEENNEEGQEKEEVIQEEPELPTETLQYGDEGDEVTVLIHHLKTIGYDFSQEEKYDEEVVWAVTDIQLQHEDLDATGIYDESMQSQFDSLKDNDIEIGKGLSEEAKDALFDEDDINLNPYHVLSLVNKEFALPDDYEPEDLTVPDVAFPFEEDLPKKKMRQVAATALEDMFQAAESEGLEIFAQSGYRSYDRQNEIFSANVAEHGEEEANQFSARPGESEHQTGLTMDVTARDVEFQLIEAFGETDEGRWLQDNAHEFGFIIRYPKGKEDITKYDYEPWHLRYVGEKAARDIAKEEITLEEYLELN